MKRFLLILLLSFFSKINFAQSELPAFGVYSEGELNLRECTFDKDAEAVVLLDEAYTDYFFLKVYGMKTTRRVRIKILNAKGVNRANISLPFYSKDEYEFISNIEGITYTDNQAYNLQSNSVFLEKGELYSKMKFAMPNVKPGSIIEYKFELSRKNYDLDDWSFQSDIPTLRSCYLIHLHPRTEFSYVVSKKESYPIVLKEFKEETKYYFEMDSIPGLREEPFMDARKEYLQRIEFQLATVSTAYGDKKTVNRSWKEIAFTLSTEKNLGGTIKKNLPGFDDLKLLVNQQNSTAGKLAVTYNYVRKNFSWNGYYGLSAADGLKKVCESRTGSASEINLVLVNLLLDYDMDAYPLAVAERNYGKVDPRFPLIESFHKTVAYAVVDNKTYILDATEKFCPPGLTPFSLLNTYALVIDRKTKDLLQIGNKNESYKIFAVVNASVDKTGLLSGNASIFDYDYAKTLQTELIKKDEKKVIQHYEQNNDGLMVQDFSYENLDNDSVPMIEHVAFKNQPGENGGFILLNCNLFTGLKKNPFTSEERFTNINFGFPINIDVQLMIDLPENCQADELPKNKRLTTPDKDIYVSREIKQSGQEIQVRIKFVQTTTMVPFDTYPELKQFYKLMVDMLNEPITVKINSK